MIAIYKYEVPAPHLVPGPSGDPYETVVKMPEGAEILCVNTQLVIEDQSAGVEERLYLWAKVNTDRPLVKQSIFIYPTGIPIVKDKFQEYIGSAFFKDNRLVMHVYARTALGQA